MGRKSLKMERSEQILKGFMECIKRYGVEGSSLEKIAQEAGIKRSIIRHYIGNREELIKRMVERLTDDYLNEWDKAIANIPGEDITNGLLDSILMESPPSLAEDNLIMQRLMEVADKDPYIRQLLIKIYMAFQEKLTFTLADIFSQPNIESCRAAAYSMICIANGHGEFIRLGLVSTVHDRAVRSSMQMMMNTLKS